VDLNVSYLGWGRKGAGGRGQGAGVRARSAGRSSSSSPLSYDSITREAMVVGSLGGMSETSESGKPHSLLRNFPFPFAFE